MYAEGTEAGNLLLALLLDVEDTFVTMKTSKALIARRDTAALRVYARGYANAAPDSVEFFENPGRLSTGHSERHSRGFLMTGTPRLRPGAREILVWLEAGYGGHPTD